MGGRGKEATFGVLLRAYRSLQGTISPSELEGILGAETLRGDMRNSPEALREIQDHLRTKGFTAAPSSCELVALLNEMPAEQLRAAGADFRSCVGLSREQLLSAEEHSFLSPHIARIVLASLSQLEAALPAESAVLGPLEGTYRGFLGGIGWMHKDEHRTSEYYVEQALFPLLRNELIEDGTPQRLTTEPLGAVFQHYEEFRARLAGLYPDLMLPAAPDHIFQSVDVVNNSAREDLQSLTTAFTKEVVAAISEFRLEDGRPLVFDIVNVWIPKADKQMALLPLEHSGEGFYEHDTRPTVEEVEALGLQNEFQALGKGTAALFFGRYLLHQAADGPDFVKCHQGSMETRYLVLAPRGSLHRFSNGHQKAPPEGG